MKKFIVLQLLVLMMLLSPAGLIIAANADNVYVKPVNSLPSNFVMRDWVPVQTTPYTTGLRRT